MKILSCVAQRNGNGEAGRKFYASPLRARSLEILSSLLLLFLFGCIHAGAQSIASLSIGGTMPAIQRLEISPAELSTTASNQFTVTLNTRVNVGAGYTITIQSQTTGAQLNADQVACELTCNGNPITLAAGTETVLPKSANDRLAQKILHISQPHELASVTLAFTIISQ